MLPIKLFDILRRVPFLLLEELQQRKHLVVTCHQLLPVILNSRNIFMGTDSQQYIFLRWCSAEMQLWSSVVSCHTRSPPQAGVLQLSHEKIFLKRAIHILDGLHGYHKKNHAYIQHVFLLLLPFVFFQVKSSNKFNNILLNHCCNCNSMNRTIPPPAWFQMSHNHQQGMISRFFFPIGTFTRSCKAGLSWENSYQDEQVLPKWFYCSGLRRQTPCKYFCIL